MGARFRFGAASDGDLALGSDGDVDARRRAIVDLPWTWLHQVHGSTVVTVTTPGEHAGADADAAVTDQPGAVLAVNTADCAPVVLWSESGAVGVAHAGWRGLADGVIEATVNAMAALGAHSVRAALGPCIGPCCYEFGVSELTTLALQFGPDVVGATSDGQPAFDLPEAVRSECHRLGVPLDDSAWLCTATSPVHFSWRARRDTGRQSTIVWWEP